MEFLFFFPLPSQPGAFPKTVCRQVLPHVHHQCLSHIANAFIADSDFWFLISVQWATSCQWKNGPGLAAWRNICESLPSRPINKWPDREAINLTGAAPHFSCLKNVIFFKHTHTHTRSRVRTQFGTNIRKYNGSSDTRTYSAVENSQTLTRCQSPLPFQVSHHAELKFDFKLDLPLSEYVSKISQVELSVIDSTDFMLWLGQCCDIATLSCNNSDIRYRTCTKDGPTLDATSSCKCIRLSLGMTNSETTALQYILLTIKMQYRVSVCLSVCLSVSVIGRFYDAICLDFFWRELCPFDDVVHVADSRSTASSLALNCSLDNILHVVTGFITTFMMLQFWCLIACPKYFNFLDLIFFFFFAFPPRGRNSASPFSTSPGPSPPLHWYPPSSYPPLILLFHRLRGLPLVLFPDISIFSILLPM